MEWFFKIDALLDEVVEKRREVKRVQDAMDAALIAQDNAEFNKRLAEVAALYDRIHTLEAEIFAA